MPYTGLDWPRIIKLVAAVLIASFVGIKFYPELARSQDAVRMVGQVSPFLAAFWIVAILLIVGPILQQAESWGELVAMKRTIRNRLFRCCGMFFLCLVILSLAFVISIVPADSVVLPFLYGGVLFLTTFCFLVSFTLPGVLSRSQMARYQAELDKVTPKVLKDLESDKKNKK